MEKSELRNLEREISSRVLGQRHAIAEICRVVSRCELGFTPDEGPLSSFLLLGPTGVGKTETCRVLAELLYGTCDLLIRFDMSEFMSFESVGLFLERIDILTRDREQTGGCLLFDEMEKAHPRILDLFLQILSAARLTYADHRVGDFSKFYIFFTSNLGSEVLMDIKSPNFPFTAIEKGVLARARQNLRPEFFGRVKKKIVFRKLDLKVQREIARLHLDRETSRWGVTYDDESLELIIRKGIDVRFGARPLKGVIEDEVHNALAKRELEGGGDAGILRVENQTLRVA